MTRRLERWFGHDRGDKKQQVLQKCHGSCKRAYALDALVFINYCYHKELSFYRHRSCAGMRLLCRDCHLRMGTLDYYLGQLHEQAQAQPDQYPWADCEIGMRLYLTHLEQLVARGVDPASLEQLEIAW